MKMTEEERLVEGIWSLIDRFENISRASEGIVYSSDVAALVALRLRMLVMGFDPNEDIAEYLDTSPVADKIRGARTSFDEETY